MRLKQKVEYIASKLEELYPNPEIPLDHENNFTFLIAVMLSAQSTDKKVNEITPKLFSIANTPEKMDRLKVNEIRDLLIDPKPKAEDQEKVSEKSASVQGKRFSDEVKDVLAALNNLVARVQSIGELRKKNGRKLGVSATEALRQVQESVQDAFDELDKFVDEFGTEGALETEVEEIIESEATEQVEAETEVEAEAEVQTEEAVEVEEAQAEATETPAEEVEAPAEAETEVEAEAEAVVEDEVSEVEVDSELDDLWLESQQIVTDAILTDIEIEEDE